ncbi:MAG: hypothetical protein AMS14_10160 [Planctomycetes bacterium DG_20]|nr:MAG: hypothetical protein AMS14_10160 [Planctomycetes bacterium DG_20]
MGVVGGLIVIVGLGVLLWGILRAVLARRDAFCKWTATGALVGVGAMLLHSLFDYNLTKITSNGIVFATLLGLAFVAAKMPGTQSSRTGGLRYWALPLKAVPARLAVALSGVGLMASIPFLPVTAALRSDIHFNRYLALAGEPDDYFFLSPRSGSDGGGDLVGRALDLEPDNPRYLAAAASRALAGADELLRRRACEQARAILGSDFERKDPKGFHQIVEALAANLKPHVLAERRPFLLQAEALLRRAVSAAPTVAQYHLDLADVLAELDPRSPEVAQQARIALWLAPNTPAVLFDGGRLLLAEAVALEPAEERKRQLAAVQDCFRRAMYADPSYGALIYPLVRATMGGQSVLLAVTPRTVAAHEQLSHALWEARDWAPLLVCLDTIEALACSDRGAPLETRPDAWPRPGDDIGLGTLHRPPEAGGGLDPRDRLRVRLSAAQRRCAVLGILGRWRQREDAVSHYRGLLRQLLQDDLVEARRLRQRGRSQEALAIHLRVLQQDWSNPEARLEAAEIAALPRVLNGLPPGNTSVDHLYYLVINNTELSPALYERAMRVLDGPARRTTSERLVADFVRGAAAVLAGRAQEGISLLQALASRQDETAQVWRQRHLIWAYLALAYENMGDRQKAIQAYRRALEILPTYRPAVLGLARLGVDVASRLEALAPHVYCNVNFGGKIVLLGYTLGRETVPVNVRGITLQQTNWFVTYYWQFHAPMFQDYHPVAHFCDENWRIIFQNDHRIRVDGKPYPMDLPRCGQVVVERLALRPDHDPAQAVYLRIGVLSEEVPEPEPRWLFHAGGEGNVTAVPVLIEEPSHPLLGQGVAAALH